MKKLSLIFLLAILLVGCFSSPEPLKIPPPVVIPKPPLILVAIESEEYKIEISRGSQIVVAHEDELVVIVRTVRMGRNWVRFFISFQNLSSYTMPYRQDLLCLDGSSDGSNWRSIHLMTASETQELFDSLALKANRPLMARDNFLYDNDIKPGETYSGERDYIQEREPIFNFYRLRVGKDSPQITVLFRRLDKEP
jgi:hypothetical protein